MVVFDLPRNKKKNQGFVSALIKGVVKVCL